MIGLIQSKAGNAVEIPLIDRIDGEGIALYPELEEKRTRMTRPEDGGLIVRDERTGITELGLSRSDHVRAVSRHTTLDTTRIYNKANRDKAADRDGETGA